MARKLELLSWKPDDEVGVRRLNASLETLLKRIWAVKGDDPGVWNAAATDPLEIERRTEALAEMRKAPDAERLIPDLFFAVDVMPRPAPPYLPWKLTTVLQSFVDQLGPTPTVLSLLRRRILFFLQGGYWSCRPPFPHQFVGDQPFPTLRDCVQKLDGWRAKSQEADQFSREIVFDGLGDGDANIPDEVIEASRDKWGDLTGRQTSHRLFAIDLWPIYWSTFRSETEAGGMSYDQFKAAALRSLTAFGSAIGDADTMLGRFERRLLDEALATWHGERTEVLERFTSGDKTPLGGRYLVSACRFIEAGVPSTDLGTSYDFPQQVLRMLARIKLDKDESDDDLADKLRVFPRTTLEALLPLAAAGKNAVLRALDWRQAEGLVEFIHGMTVVNSADATIGLVERAEALRSLNEAGDVLSRKIIDIYRRTKSRSTDGLVLLEACRGWNDNEVHKGLARHSQVKVKALGLLPLDKESAVDRYLTLKQIEKEASRHGPEQQANLRAAVAQGIDHLAQTAGHADADSFIIEMELQMARDVAGKASARCGEYAIELIRDRHAWTIRVSKGGKTLKTAPPVVRKSEEWEDLRDRRDRLVEQSARFRRFFEAAMVCGLRVDAKQVLGLGGLQAGAAIVSQLLFADDENRFIRFVEGRFERLDGAPSNSPRLRVPHVADLSDKELKIAQDAVLDYGWRQPFKQAFRECYRMTDNERIALITRRAAGHAVSSSVATRLLQSRGWNQKSSDVPEISKRFPSSRLIAHFDFPDARHFLASEPMVTTGEIEFLRDYRRIPLSEVPAAVFSEVARDADLVAAIARTGEDQFSDESYERRAQLVLLIAGRLGVKGLKIDGRFVVVKGEHARYRVHVGSATAFLDSGTALALRPSSPIVNDPYLPFAEDDLVLVEAINKVLFLANDGAAKDASFLKQVRGSKG